MVPGFADPDEIAGPEGFMDGLRAAAGLGFLLDCKAIVGTVAGVVGNGVLSDRLLIDKDVDMRACGEWRETAAIRGRKLHANNIFGDDFDAAYQGMDLTVLFETHRKHVSTSSMKSRPEPGSIDWKV
ncbi:hypothetical protein [Mesorhizobium sp. L-8-10]|uniref:hypothetical protein n=1 Tax=Mesorhizobium sp. L-8-10 TaxID=2744523 RepID=UPI001927BB21|nr:hypothetical protein [Mesorhizobium sp. L-8-10]